MHLLNFRLHYFGLSFLDVWELCLLLGYGQLKGTFENLKMIAVVCSSGFPAICGYVQNKN